MPRFCRFCGAELKNPQARFCPSCGRQLTPTGTPPPSGGGKAEARFHLLVRIPGAPPHEVSLDKDSFTIGRRPDNDIVLPPKYISGHHGRLERRGSDWYYTDLDSTNGTFVNGRRVKQTPLQDGDILRIGDPTGNSVSLTFQARREAGAPLPTAGVVHIGTTALKLKPRLIIGRDPRSDIQLPSPVVSWHHARLDRTAQGYRLSDLHSTNGTFVNGTRLVRPHLLRQGDVVQIGPFKLVYEATGFQHYTASGGVRLDGVHLTREVGRGKRKKRILNDISLSIYPREFVALVGTSGAGKSTLMMALNGFVRAEQGQVLINGDDLYRHFDLYRTMVGYVPQDDIIHKDLTVANALRYAARLRLPPDTSDEEIERRVDEVLREVEMIGQKEQVVGSLSGGQRKRVSIAVELLAEPKLFFLDEPTSGLDPGLEKKMMYTLRRLADGGRTILLVTHATANIAQCDHVCFLSQGRMVYFGPPEEALEYFGVTGGDFADIYAQLDDPDPQVARRKAADGETRFRQSPQYRQYVADRQRSVPLEKQRAASGATGRKRPKVSSIGQFFVLTRRYLDLVLRDRLLLTVLLAIMPVIGLLLLITSEANWLIGDSPTEIARQLNLNLSGPGSSATYAIVSNSQLLLFMMALASVLLGIFAAAYEIVKERSIYQRERMVSLRLIPYLGSKIGVLTMFALVQCLLFMLVVSGKVDLPGEGAFLPAPLEMYITLVLGSLAAIMLGLLISAFVPNANTVIYVILLVLFAQIIFAGVIFDLPGLAGSISNLTLTRWAMEALGTSANMEYLNGLTRTRFVPEPLTKEVSMEVERPAEDWEPVSVVTKTENVEVPCPSGVVLTVPITVPEVTENEMLTVTETVTKSITVTPEPLDILTPREFQIDYSRSPAHLLKDWLMLLVFGAVFGAATVLILKSKDIG